MSGSLFRGFHIKDQHLTEEADETLFWFELLLESDLIKPAIAKPMISEREELLKICSASLATAKRNR